jgi:capsular exopolysaccharide synthesis family protein
LLDLLRDPDQVSQEVQRQLVIDEFLRNLSVTHLVKSRVVELSFTSNNPETAARVANSVAEQYQISKLDAKYENAQRSSNWLVSKVQILRDRVEQSEKNVEDYRQKHDLFEGVRATLLAQEISELNSKMTDATIARNTAESNLAQARRLVASGDMMSMVQVLDSALIQKYREQELDLARKESEMGQQYGPRHPMMIQFKAEKKAFAAKVQDEISKILRRLENEAQIARQREASTAKELEALKSQMAQSNSAAVGLRALQRDADANRLLVEKFLNAFMQTTVQQDANAQAVDGRIISPAETPIRPSFPKTLPIVVVGFSGSLLLGVLLAFAAESLDVRYRSAEQVESDLGIPVLAQVPMMRKRERQGSSLTNYVVEQSGSAFVESVRALYRGLLLRAGLELPKTILFTSAEPGEGKTTIALTLARVQARAGQDVVFVDGDVRRSVVAVRLGLNESPGFIELLAGQATLPEVIQCDSSTGARIIVAGRFTPDMADLINSDRVHECLARIRNTCRLIVVDSPPLNAISDARVFAAEADATLLVVGWGKTKRQVVKYAVKTLVDSHIDIDGLVLSQVDLTKRGGYSYGDSAQYGKNVQKYYARA